MREKKPKPVIARVPIPGVLSPVMASPPGSGSEGEAERIAASTVTIRLDEHGEPLPMKAENIERAAEAVAKLRGAGALGEAVPAVPSELEPVGFELFDEAFTGRVLDGVEIAQGFLASKMVDGISYEQARKLCAFTQSDRRDVSGPLAAVLNKHSPAWLAAHQDVVGLAVVLGSLEVQKFSAFAAIMANKTKEERK